MAVKQQHNIPLELQGIFWSKNIRSLDLIKDKAYIVNQVLSYGDINDLRWLFRIYSSREIVEIFVSSPSRIYEPAVFRFIKNNILGLATARLDEKKYVKSFSRHSHGPAKRHAKVS